MSRIEDTITNHPHPGADPVCRLRHTLDIYGDDTENGLR